MQSTTTWAMNYDTVQKLRPFPDFGMWGPDDPYFHAARDKAGIQNFTEREVIVFHQAHHRRPGPASWDIINGAARKMIDERLK
jgi:hypothetical protein